MRITIAHDEIEKSSISEKTNGGLSRLNEIPNKLKNNLIKELGGWIKHFGLKELLVSEKDIDDTILIFGNKKSSLLKNVHHDSRQPLKELLRLLVWYFKQHFSSYHPQAIGSDVYCSDCKQLQSSFGEYCENPNCPSHEKWRAIIGASYKPPKEEAEPIQIFPIPISTQKDLDAFLQQIKAHKR